MLSLLQRNSTMARTYITLSDGDLFQGRGCAGMFWWKLSLAELLTIKQCFYWLECWKLIAQASVFVFLCVRNGERERDLTDSFQIPRNDSRGSEGSEHSTSLLRSHSRALSQSQPSPYEPTSNQTELGNHLTSGKLLLFKQSMRKGSVFNSWQ